MKDLNFDIRLTVNYSVKIKAQKAGVTIEATAKDKAGNVSKKATKVVAKK